MITKHSEGKLKVDLSHSKECKGRGPGTSGWLLGRNINVLKLFVFFRCSLTAVFSITFFNVRLIAT